MKKLNLMLSRVSPLVMWALLALGMVQPAFAAPANDNFASAQVITTTQGTMNGTNVGATKEAGEPTHGGSLNPYAAGSTVWYRWTPGKGNATLTVTASFSIYVRVYTGNSVDILTVLRGNSGTSALVDWRAEAGKTYHIAIDSMAYITSPPVPLQTGAFTLNWQLDASPANDDFANATPIAGTTGTIAGNNRGAFTEPNEPYNHARNSSVWYRWTAPSNGSVIFDTEGSSFDTLIAAFTGATMTEAGTYPNWRSSDNDGGTNTLSKMVFTVVGGTTYTIAVGGPGYEEFTGPRGAFKLNWAFTPAPANDNFASAQNLLPVNGGTLQGTNVGANRETNEYGVNSQLRGESIWYKFTAPMNGALTLDTAGTQFDTILGVYTGTSLQSLVRLALGQDDAALTPGLASRVKFDAQSGVTYHIAIEGQVGEQLSESSTGYYVTHGPVTFNWNFTPAPANDLFANAQVIQGSAGQVAGVLVGANSEPFEPDHNSIYAQDSSIWYRWTAPASGNVTFDTRASVTSTNVTIYTGESVATLTRVGFDSPNANNQLEATFPVQAGTIYHVALDTNMIIGGGTTVLPGYDTVHGDTVLRWSLNSTPVVAPTQPTITGVTPATGPIGTTVTITGTGFTGATQVRFNGTTATFTVNSATTITATVPFGVLTGKITVHTPQGIGTSAASFVVTQGPPPQPPGPANNNFASATAITAATMTGTNVGATKETGEPNHAGNPGGRSVWWRWTAPSNGTVTFDTVGSNFDTLLGLYTGTGVNLLTERAQNDDAVTGTATSRIVNVPVTGGTIYYIAVDGYTDTNGTASGNITLAYSFTATTTTAPGSLHFSTSSTSINEGAGTATITVTRSGGSTGAVGVSYATSNSTATAGSDYTAKTGTLSFAAGVTTQTFTVAILNDTLYETSEAINLTLSAPTGGATLGTPSTATLTIVDNDGLANDNFASATAITAATMTGSNVGATKETGEPDHAGDPGGKSVWWKWTAPSNGTVTFDTVGSNFDTLLGLYTGTGVNLLTERAQNDDAVTGTATSRIVNVPVTGGTIYYIAVDGYSDINGLAASGNITLTYSFTSTTPSTPGSLHFSTSSYTINESVATATITVTRSGGSTGAVGVSYATSNSTATAGSDYTAKTGTLSFAAGVTTQTFTVAILNDTLYETSEAINLTLSAPTGGATLGTQSTATLAITSDDALPALTISDATITESNAGTVNATFNVTLSAASGQITTVNYTTAAATATATTDYTTTSGTLSFPAGTTSRSITVPVVGDTVIEPNETFQVNLSSATNATIADAQGIGTITNDDTLSLSINDISVNEGNAGTTSASFTVRLAAASTSTVTVNYATAAGTAAATTDFTTTSGALSFAAGTTTQTVTVPVIGDTIIEPNETFSVNLSSAVGATISDAQGIGTITNDDALSLSINDISVTEGNTGTTSASFTVRLAAASTSTVTVNYTTAVGTAATTDYTTTSGTLTFPAGTTTLTITVPVVGDLLSESNETFFVNLSSAVGATISDAQGIGTIINDDTLSLSINDINITEGNTGTTSASFTVRLAAASTSAVTVNYTTAAGTATATTDFTTTSGTLTFPAGTTTLTVTVPVIGETVIEPNETFSVNLSGAVGATISDAQGIGTIVNDDVAPTTGLSINDIAVMEGNSGTTNATFTVSLSPAPTQQVTVNYAITDNTANTGSDYTASTGTLTFPAGTTSRAITVPIAGNTLVEPDETYFINLSAASGAPILDGLGVGTIINDDRPTMAINDITVNEGNTGTTTSATFTVTLSAASTQAITVNYTTAAGTATAGGDYTTTTGTLTFPAGTTSRTITVPVIGDTLSEANETFLVNLSTVTNATLADAQGQGTITNDDVAASPSGTTGPA